MIMYAQDDLAADFNSLNGKILYNIDAPEKLRKPIIIHNQPDQ